MNLYLPPRHLKRLPAKATASAFRLGLTGSLVRHLLASIRITCQHRVSRLDFDPKNGVVPL